MRSNCLKLMLALLVIAFAPVALAERSTGESLDDATLATRVKGALVDNDKVTASHINVEVYQGTVQLGGFVDSKTEHDAALAAARRIGAASKIIDAMVVLPGHRSLGQTIDDAAAQASLKTKLAQIEGLGAAHKINTEVKQGHVLLTGFLGHADQIAKAGEIARGIGGIREVHNKITLKP